ncbi:MAG: ATP-binding protein [Gammaproteobacteria bacterium]|nr:ATP-binding protein [Gammaproteobacteria bacterium]
MVREYRLPPSASSLSASMRDLGYSVETAIADLIDNSISANATTVEIFCDLSVDGQAVVIIDNGCGMDAEGVIAAMRHGSTSPGEERSSGDLGRFGLGLKTASFSQCRRLTVVSAKNSIRSSAEWDLDIVDRKDDWLISILDGDEIGQLPYIHKLGKNGTIVIWRELDRLFEDETDSKRDEIVNEKLDAIEKHISLVFHRFLAGEMKGRRKLSISINGHKIEPFDPFCLKNRFTQRLPEEIIRTGDATVRMQPYILPHHSKLSAKEYDHYQSRSDFISNQGAYVYRSGRLMVWGDWFRLIPKGEATKLARVQIDFPNSMDESWTIDIRKSRARPPHAVRIRLRQIINRISGRSTTVHRGRGEKLYNETVAPVWVRYADQGRIRYALNSEHPIVQTVSQNLQDKQRGRLTTLLEAISSSLPVEMIYSDFSMRPREIQQSLLPEESVIGELKQLKDILFSGAPDNSDTFREVMRSTHLFDSHMDLVERFIRDEFR